MENLVVQRPIPSEALAPVRAIATVKLLAQRQQRQELLFANALTVHIGGWREQPPISQKPARWTGLQAS
jgi:hypothetical protein